MSGLRPSLPTGAAAYAGWWLVCLCAEWCGVCRSYRATFDALAARHAGLEARWLDVEDEAGIAGDTDVETFPTLLVADPAGTVRFLGPLAPHAAVLERLLSQLRDSMATAGGPASVAAHGVDAEAQALFERIRAAHPKA